MTTIKTPNRLLARIVAIGLLGVSPALLASCQKQTDTTDKDPLNVETRIDELQSKEEIRSILMEFEQAADSANPASFAAMGPYLDPTFSLDITEFDGTNHHFDGVQGLVQGFGPLLIEADAKLVPGQVHVELEQDGATAYYKVITSVKPSPDLNLDPDTRVLVFCTVTANLMRDDGNRWKLRSIDVVDTLAYPGKLGG